MEKYENIELRSEKVRNIIGRIPSQIIRSGVMVITVILMLLIVGLIYIPYPDSLKSVLVVTEAKNDEIYADAYIPYKYFDRIDDGATVEIELDGYNSLKYGYIEGKIEKKIKTVIVKNRHNYFVISIIARINNSDVQIKKNMEGYCSM